MKNAEKASIVLGLNFGDEGKGRTVSWLADKNPRESLVIRFNGGHQAGHTVFFDNKRHVFSSFGAATLQGVPTYWSKFCTVHPVALVNEYNALKEFGVDVRLYIDDNCPVTTPYDVRANIHFDSKNNNGTCGVGFGKTIERNELLKFIFSDLKYKGICEEKLNNIKKYYELQGFKFVDDAFNEAIKRFNYALSEIQRLFIGEDFGWVHNKDITHIIMEGAQGVLLDQEHGFFPHVTRSKTTAYNAFRVLGSLPVDVSEVDIYYVTRRYLTRHGNGYLPNECPLDFMNIINNEHETNQDNQYQGQFRYANLNADLLEYAIQKADSDIDRNARSIYDIKTNLVVTCMDQQVNDRGVPDKINIDVSKDGIQCHVKEYKLQEMADEFSQKRFQKFTNIFYSDGKETERMKQAKY